MAAPKLNLVKQFKSYYTAKTTPQIVELEEGLFLAIEGRGAPASEEFQERISALYSLAYAVKMQMKRKGRDFAVPPLEGLWWVDSDKHPLEVPREEWRYKLLIRLPDFVTEENVERMKEEVVRKKKLELVREITLERMKEGMCIQILHIGPYSTESESVAKMRKLMDEEGLVENGLHHEIYLSDPRRVPEEKLKTILRQPVKKRE